MSIYLPPTVTLFIFIGSLWLIYIDTAQQWYTFPPLHRFESSQFAQNMPLDAASHFQWQYHVLVVYELFPL